MKNVVWIHVLVNKEMVGASDTIMVPYDRWTRLSSKKRKKLIKKQLRKIAFELVSGEAHTTDGDMDTGDHIHVTFEEGKVRSV